MLLSENICSPCGVFLYDHGPVMNLILCFCLSLHNNVSETGNARSITLTNSSGLIAAPDATGRGLYDENVDILWIIEAVNGQIIRFHLLFAQIRYSNNCFKDGLRV